MEREWGDSLLSSNERELEEKIMEDEKDFPGLAFEERTGPKSGELKFGRREQGIRLLNKVTGEQYRVPNERAARQFFSARGVYAGTSAAQSWEWKHPKDEPEEWAYRKDAKLPWGSWPGWEEAERFVAASITGLEVKDVDY